jgi:glycosyltransferase involved in cell wall biosynthesis
VDQVRSIAPDTNAIAYPNAIPYREMPARAPENRIVFSGNFEYHPNIDAVAFLVREIWPPIRRAHADVRLHLVGRGDSRIRHLIRHDSRIDTTGEIENAPDEIASAQVVIAPLRAGSGTRIKILEAWAAGRAVVATSIAAEGLEARHGENCIIADSPAEFSASVVRLLASQQERNRIAERGRRTFEHSYTWPAAWKILDNSLQLKEFINA